MNERPARHRRAEPCATGSTGANHPTGLALPTLAGRSRTHITPLRTVNVMKGHYWVTVARSDSVFQRDIRTITAATLADAEREAQVLLRTKRLAAPDGALWNSWSVSTCDTPRSLPRLVACGDHLYTHYTERENGWTD